MMQAGESETIVAQDQGLMATFSVPRPNGSQAERQTAESVRAWLDLHQLSYRLHTFRQYPYFFEALGAWMIAASTLLSLSIAFRWGWVSLLLAAVGLAGSALEGVFNIHLVSWPGMRTGENIIMEFEPAGRPAEQEIVISAHYDSKTELLDHHERMFFLVNLRTAMAITPLIGFLGLLDGLLLQAGSPWDDFVLGAAIILCIFLLFISWGYGLNLSTGRLLAPSQGAVDNGAACAILLKLARSLKETPLYRTRVTLALFTGEEVQFQGSRAYIQSRDWPLPVCALNLEVMAQDGAYVYWEQDGTVFSLRETSPSINELLAEAVEEVTGSAPRPAGPLTSDGGSFLAAGIPAAVLGTYSLHYLDRGFHRPADNMNRVVLPRLEEGAHILRRLIARLESQPGI